MSQTRITIRPLRHTDASDIYELMHMPNVLWGTSLLPSTPIDSWYKTVENWVYDERMHVFVADVQGKVAGIINMRAGTGRESHVGDIDMAVHDKYQGQGIGKMLLLTVIDLADNCSNLILKLKGGNALTLSVVAVILIVILWRVCTNLAARKGLDQRKKRCRRTLQAIM